MQTILIHCSAERSDRHETIELDGCRNTSFSCSSSRFRFLELAELRLFDKRPAFPDAVFDVGAAQPPVHAPFGDPEIAGYLRDRSFLTTSHRNDIAAELLRETLSAC